MTRKFLMFYIVGLVLFGIIFVPQVEVKTVISSQKVPREVVIDSYVMPIFVTETRYAGDLKNFARSKVDYARYFLNLFIYHIIVGIIFCFRFFPKKEKEEKT